MRKVEFARKTSETDIKITIDLDGAGEYDIHTGIGFFDHMLMQFAKHSGINLTIVCAGDTHIDCHHTVEDVGIALGEAIKKALGDKASIERFGEAVVPMDEVLVLTSLDFSGRPYLNYDVVFTSENVGEMKTEMLLEFFRAISVSAGITLHIKQFCGVNNHHIAECVFKSFAKSFARGIKKNNNIKGVLSTKGVL